MIEPRARVDAATDLLGSIVMFYTICNTERINVLIVIYLRKRRLL